jgi:phospholipid/cholesterol/gamma-HCH transport system permease protein
MIDTTATLAQTPNSATQGARFVFDAKNNRYLCEGRWSTLCLGDINADFKPPTSSTSEQTISISAEHLEAFDSAGALALLQFIDVLKQAGNNTELTHFNDGQNELLRLIKDKQHILNKNPPTPPPAPHTGEDFVEALGREAVHKFHQCDGILILVGDLTNRIFLAFGNWRRFQFPSIVSNINTTGIQALPIIALLSFLIGVVLAYQMGLQLETYGANIFIAYLSGMAIFREFAPLITAIIVAGRTSSAFTAQIGSMKINEEIDALTTMGLSPTELLVLPKVLGLLFVLPLVIFWADVFSILGSMVMSKFMLHVSYYEFLTRLKLEVGTKQLMLGLYKAPAFALLISLVGCFQGFRVRTNADSIGSQTTKSVVQALFLIIIADAVYSIIYSWLDL